MFSQSRAPSVQQDTPVEGFLCSADKQITVPQLFHQPGERELGSSRVFGERRTRIAVSEATGKGWWRFITVGLVQKRSLKTECFFLDSS